MPFLPDYVSEYSVVFLVILSVFFENTGFMKNGPRQSQFEPTEGNVIMFTDVHGVDEAKDVTPLAYHSTFMPLINFFPD